MTNIRNKSTIPINKELHNCFDCKGCICKKHCKNEQEILTLLYTGMRIGEAVALTWDDIDLGKKEIRISKSAELLTNQPVINDPKTAAGNRTIPIVEPLFIVLNDMNDQRNGKIIDIAKIKKSKKKKAEYVFKNVENEDHLTKIGMQRLLDSYRLAIGFNLTFHQLRHTCVTLLYDSGVGIKEAQAWLGHSTVSVTMDIYTHLDDTNRNQAATQMNSMLKST